MALRWDDILKTLDLAVGDLVAVERTHLQRSSAFSSRARMEAGVEAHKAVQAALLDEFSEEFFQAEVRVRHRLVLREWTVTIHGRMDGVTEEGGHRVVEEIKSSALPEDILTTVEHFPAYERQLKLYLWFLRQAGTPAVGRLRLVSLVDGCERLIHIADEPGFEAEVLEILDELVLARMRRCAWLARRREAAFFPAFPVWRPNQEELSKSAQEAIYRNKHLLVVAPTGIGKTAAVLHGALKAARARDLQLVWLTARTTQRFLVLETLQKMAALGTGELRAIVLAAKEQVCLNRAWDGTVQVDCRPESCRFATNYYEKLKNHDALGRFEALPEPMQVRVWAEGMEVCPHALALDRIEEVDVIIGDFNHVFDPDAEVRRLEPDKLVLVVDEAHQLPERVMEAASPVLPLALVDAVLQHYSDPQHEALRVLALQVATEIRDAPLRAITIDGVAAGNEQEVVVEAPLKRWQGVRDAMDEVGWDHLKLRTEFGVDPWLELARAVFRFVRTLEQAGEETVAIAGIGGEPTVEELAEGALVVAGQHLRLCCRDPARLLAPRFAAFVATIQLSATLHPVGFHQDRCGLAPERVLQFEATPFFPPQNRLVLTVPGVSTAWKHRDRDRDAVAAIVEQTVMSIVGNVAVFFTSYQQMRDVGNALVLPGKVLLKQEPGLAEEDRRRIISAVKEGTDRVLLAVLGGIFAEGVDIPEGLVGVVVVGPGFPPPTLDRKLQQKWLEDVYGDGFERAFVLPGMTRVVQASGRVIRSEHDKGVVVLVCQRFGQSQLRAYLPKDWLVEKSKKPWEEIKVFFEGEPEPPEGAMVLRAIRSRAMVGEVEVGEVEVGKKRRRKVKEVGMPQLGLFRTAKRAEDAEDAEGKTEGERT